MSEAPSLSSKTEVWQQAYQLAFDTPEKAADEIERLRRLIIHLEGALADQPDRRAHETKARRHDCPHCVCVVEEFIGRERADVNAIISGDKK